MKSACLHSLVLFLALFVMSYTAPGQSAYEPGKSYFGRSNYVEYIAGDMPLIISAPHGGTLRPGEVSDRKQGEFTSDAYTQELARELQRALHDRFGHFPHVIICRLARRKVDCNRELAEGAGEDAAAQQAWRDYHGFIELARSNVLTTARAGFYLDLHGQSHAIQRIELGYGLTRRQLTNADSMLNLRPHAEANTVGGLVRRTGTPFAQLLRGTNSLGALLAAKGYPAVPSPEMPDPGAGNPYFDGGYDVRRHGSAKGGAVDGVQMELNYRGVRDTSQNRAQFALALAQVLEGYFTRYYGFDLRTGRPCLGGTGLLDQAPGTGGN